MKYFKIWLGFSKSVQIDEVELPKVLKAQALGANVYLKNGVVNSKHISLIEPDYNRAMGWNDDYKPQGEDYVAIRNECGEYKTFLENAERMTLENHQPLKLN